MAQVRISAKDLGVLALPKFCPRCFWIKMHCENKLPFQIFPGIFSSIDSYTKKVTNVHFHRYNHLPSWLGELGELGRPMKVPHHSKFRIVDEKSDVIGKRQGFDPISGLALVYMEPQTDLTEDELDSILNKEGFLMGFAGHVLPLKLEAEQRIPPLLEEVRRIYDLESPPPGNEECRDCVLLNQLVTIAGDLF
jgi:hypothetical protein